MQIRQGKNKQYSGVSVPLLLGITGVNEHIELVFNAVLSNAVVMLESQSVSIDRTIGPSLQISSKMSQSLVFFTQSYQQNSYKCKQQV